MNEKQTLGRKWSRLFAEALEFDSWGQIEEAQETYTRYGRWLRHRHERPRPAALIGLKAEYTHAE
jgi:hypothetical protein